MRFRLNQLALRLNWTATTLTHKPEPLNSMYKQKNWTPEGVQLSILFDQSFAF